MVRCPRCHRRLRAGRCVDHGPPTHVAAVRLPASPPALVDGWQQHECLAVGGSAQVFAAVGRDGRAAVVKWARWRDAAAVRRFAREASLLRRVPPDVVPRVEASVVVDGWPGLVLERLPGLTLAERIAGESAEDTRAAATSRLIAIARAVMALHRHGVVHADLKPENIFLDGERARLIDLGLAVAAQRDDQTGDGGGTPHYTAPEQLAGTGLQAGSDVYAFGAIAFELLTGVPPFVGDRPAIEYGHALCRPPHPGELAPVARELDALVVACLAKDPLARPSFDTVLETLGSATTAAVSVSRGAQRPARVTERGLAALVWVGRADRAHVARLFGDAAGRIVRERTDGTLAAFLWHDHEDPVAAAFAVASRLPCDAAVVVHCGRVAVRNGARIAVHGDAVDHPERWRPPTPWTGVLATSEATRHLAVQQVGPESTPGFYRFLAADRPARSQIATVPELVVRHSPVGHVLSAIDAALAGDAPCLVTIAGRDGSGKTRTLDELRRALAAHGARTIDIAGQLGIAGRPTAGPALAAALADVPGLTHLDRLRRVADTGVVVMVDDGDRVEDEILDVLETASGWEHGRLAVVIATDPALLDARPRWGAPAAHHHRFTLQPLDDDAARAFLRRQLAPARRVPDALVARLAARAGGNPGTLVALAREIHRLGLVRRVPGGEDFYVAADELDLVALEPDRRWRASALLARLPAGMPALVRTCAVLGAGFDLADLDAAVRALPRAETAIDPAAGAAWLTRHGILRGDRRAWSIADAGLAETAEEQVDPPVRRAIHLAVLARALAATPGAAVDDDTDAERLARLAHHARGAGQVELAATAFATLARLARARHGHVEAARMATQAIGVLDGDGDGAGTSPRLAAQAFLERGRARRPMAMFESARADLARARELAVAAGDRTLEIEALVEDGAVCDFTDRLIDSAAAIEAAAALTSDATPPAVRARLDNWIGVVHARQGNLDEARQRLDRAIVAAEAQGEHETLVGSLLMLGSVLRRIERLDEARALVDRVIAHCEARGDVFHLTVGLFNRINLRRHAAVAEAEADCARAIEIAERHGYGQMEIAGLLNLSELCLDAGRDADALEAARRGFDVARRRFGRQPPIVVTTWLAVLAAGNGDHAEARRLLEEIDPGEAAACPVLRLRLAAVAAVLGDAPADDLDARVAELEPDDRNAFAWLLRRGGVSGLSTPACASAGTR
jgi:tetratricopeptide (TPR) repeat protein/predicted nucleic acid-binding protein